ncbi:MAG: NAD(P)-dependent oxidoreductase [Burkholderiales bacterium PBB3]|nr:MAG: NAD(P)-dependent oxidoreductase [Burkholderiales bacterium PBB3]
MPSIQSPLGALPSRFRRQRVLIIGCGDIGMRIAHQLAGRTRVLALTSTMERMTPLRAAGIVPLLGNLDGPTSLQRLAGLAHRIIHLAPPAPTGSADGRTAALLKALRGRSKPRALVYGSTSGVYGDCGGTWVSELRAVNAGTERARRRVDAEDRLRHWGRATAATICILRIPGIYAPDREGGTPRARLQKGLPVLEAAQDVYTNHIHADDLARACVRALWLGKPQRAYNVCDDSDLKMGDYFDLAAGLYGLSKPPRVTRAEAAALLSPMQLSFMGESRRLVNMRMKRELGLKLRYPSVHTGLV